MNEWLDGRRKMTLVQRRTEKVTIVWEGNSFNMAEDEETGGKPDSKTIYSGTRR